MLSVIGTSDQNRHPTDEGETLAAAERPPYLLSIGTQAREGARTRGRRGLFDVSLFGGSLVGGHHTSASQQRRGVASENEERAEQRCD